MCAVDAGPQVIDAANVRNYGEPQQLQSQKSDILLPDTALVMQLALAAEKEPAVLSEELTFDRQVKTRDAMALGSARLNSGIFPRMLRSLISRAPQSRREDTIQWYWRSL